MFWIFLSRLWPHWKDALVIVEPETVIGWSRQGFRPFWKRKSCHGKPGRPRTSKEIRELIQRMSRENQLCGAPRIHGELLKPGIDVSQATVTRNMVRHPKPPSQTWRTFLDNHVGCLVSIDFFVVPTATFAVLFVFIVLRHERRRIEHFGVTAHPAADWVARQIREAFPWGTAPRHLIRDRDGAYGQSFRSTVMAMGVEEIVTAPRSPWQNSYAERLIGSMRRECLNHVIVLSERHLRRILVSYLDYYHRSRTHLSLGKDTPRGAIGSAQRHRKDHSVPIGRQAPSSVRAARGLNTAGFCLRVSCGDEDAELHVTPAAVSQQVKVLEEDLGVRLFRRLPRGLELTQEGKAYLPELTEGLDRIAKASSSIQKDRFAGTVTLAVLPSMVANWLIPRLANFAQRLPDIRLRLHTSTDLSAFASENADIAIRYFDGAMPGMHVEFLTDEEIFPVCSPKLLNRGPPLHTLRDLRNFHLLHDVDGFRRQPWIGWPTWLADVNEDEFMGRSGFVFTDSLSLIHAALNGLGVALGRSALLGDLLVNGELVRPMRMCRKAEYRYYLVMPEHRADEPPLRAVCQWLKDRIAADYEIARH